MSELIQDKFKTYSLSSDDVQYVLNILRKGTITHPARAECLRLCRKKVEVGVIKSGPNKGKIKYKRMYQCAKCSEWFRDITSMEVDHIVEIGGFSGDWNEVIKKMYCGQFNLQALCVACHAKKTAVFNSSLRFQRSTEFVENISDICEEP